MALRNRQVSGIPLTRQEATILTLVCALMVIPLMWFGVWVSFFPFLSEGVGNVVVVIGILLYLTECFDRVPLNKERALLFFGSYTGVSFPSGICFLPKLPFPFISLVVNFVVDKNITTYFGWVLEGDVPLRSITVPCKGDGLTGDGARVSFGFDVVLEIEKASAYLAQVDGKGEDPLLRAVSADMAKQIKRVIALASLADLLRDDFNVFFEEKLTQGSDSISRFGLSVRTFVSTDFRILSPGIERSFDLIAGREFINQAALVTGQTFGAFLKEIRKHVPDIDDATAFMLYNSIQGKSLDGANVVYFRT